MLHTHGRSQDTYSIGSLLTVLLGLVGTDTVQRLPNPRLPRFHHELLRQGLVDLAVTPILCTTLQSETDLRWLHWVSKHWKVVHYQHAPKEKSLHCCANSRGDKSLAIHHTDEENIPHRLPRRCASEQQRHARRYPSTRSSESGERGKSRTVYSRCSQEDKTLTY